MNCQVCAGQRRILFVSCHPGRLDLFSLFPPVHKPISNHESYRQFWRDCWCCHGDGCEDDFDTIMIEMASLKERLKQKHRPGSGSNALFEELSF